MAVAQADAVNMHSRPHLPTHTGGGVLTSLEEPSAPPQGPHPRTLPAEISPVLGMGTAGWSWRRGGTRSRHAAAGVCPAVGSCTRSSPGLCVHACARVCKCRRVSMCARGVQQGLSKPGQPRSAAHRAAPGSTALRPSPQITATAPGPARCCWLLGVPPQMPPALSPCQ